MDGREFVHDLSEKNKCDTGGIFQISRDGSREPIGSDVAMNDVGFMSDGLALAWLCTFGECFREEG